MTGDPIVDWWLHHVAHTRSYVDALYVPQPTIAAEQAVELGNGAIKWGQLIGSDLAGILMAEHTILAKLFADRAFNGASKQELDQIAGYLLSNSIAQASLYNDMGFDGYQFKGLFDQHIAHTGAYIAALAQRNIEEFTKEFQAVLDNRDQLIHFWSNGGR